MIFDSGEGACWLAKTEGAPSLTSQIRVQKSIFTGSLFAITGNNIHVDNYIDASPVRLATEYLRSPHHRNRHFSCAACNRAMDRLLTSLVAQHIGDVFKGTGKEEQ